MSCARDSRRSCRRARRLQERIGASREAIVELDHVSLAFDRPILENVSLVARRGETIVIAGESGTGKSTILKLILRLLRPDSGRVIVDGEVLNDVTYEEALVIRQKMGMVFQGAALFDSMSVFENVAFPLREHTQLTDDEIEARVREKLEFVDLEPGSRDGSAAGGALGRHEEARRHRARHGGQSGDHALR